MAQISVTNLTFCYEGSFDFIFENVSFILDTDWKLGFIGRNGKGKTTFFRLLMNQYEYQGTISSSVKFDYFPYRIDLDDTGICSAEMLERWKPGCELWRVICELEKLQLSAEILYRPFETLSQGERTKVMLAVLFSGENEFLLIDEPTNHLDLEAKEIVKLYLGQKKGFILVSHDRDLLDGCADHVLVLNRHSIEVQSGNFSSWWENKSRRDAFSQTENEKHKREIKKLQEAADRSRRWADQNENMKIGFDPVKEHDRCISTRAYIGAKTRKMQRRVKQYENRITKEIEEKEGLLQDIETVADLKMVPLKHHKDTLISAKGYTLQYAGSKQKVFENLDFELHRGERIFLHGRNGCGKSSLIKEILMHALPEENFPWDRTSMTEEGSLTTASGMIISYVHQDTSELKGSLKAFCEKRRLNESIFYALLRQLDMDRVQFGKHMEEYSEGQKKKVLIAASLLTPAHIYIWDEPLNYIDVFSRMQLEKMILEYQPTMLAVEHDVRFREKIATKVVEISGLQLP